MNVGFYTSVSGMVAFQQNMDVLAHNMANVNTAGFKPSQSSFSDILYTQMNTNVEGEFLTGHGVKTVNTDVVMRQGPLNRTDRELDFALIGEGFFGVEYPNGEEKFTRNGAFTLSVEGKKAYLVTADGGYVMDGKGKPIQLDFIGDTNVPDFSTVAEELGVYTFPNPYGLIQTNNSSFIATEKSGDPESANKNQRDDSPYKLMSGSLEFSAVDLSQEMVNVIQSQKAFQFNAKMVQTADQIEELVNNLR